MNIAVKDIITFCFCLLIKLELGGKNILREYLGVEEKTTLTSHSNWKAADLISYYDVEHTWG